MAKKTRARNTIFCIILLSAAALQAGEDAELYRSISESSAANRRSEVMSRCSIFLKKYSRSPLTPEVLYLYAGLQNTPEDSLREYRKILLRYGGHGKAELAAFRICEILEISAKWKELRDESLHYARKFKAGAYEYRFRFFAIKAAIYTGDYESAGRESQAIIDKSVSPNIRNRALLYSSAAILKETGYSRPYVMRLSELLKESQGTEYHPASLFLLGEYYDKTRDPDRAYSAYTKCMELYPDSPESAICKTRASELKGKGASLKPFMPDSSVFGSADVIDISPVIEQEKTTKESTYFALSIGPFQDIARAKGIKKILAGFSSTVTIRTNSGFFHYTGKYSTPETALRARIRLAEEYGINGNIVRISPDNKYIYIYGDE